MKRLLKTVFVVCIALTLTVAPALAWSGGAPSDWAQSAVRSALNSGLDRWEGGAYDTHENYLSEGGYQSAITRGEFSWLLGTAAAKKDGITAYEQVNSGAVSAPPFDDVNTNYAEFPYYAELALCYQKGIVSGVSATSYGPNETLTREQAATMLSRAVRALKPELWQEGKDYLAGKNISDASKISDYAKAPIGFVMDLGLMNGVGGGRFDPQGEYTAEQAVVTVYHLCQKLSIPMTVAEGSGDWMDEFGVQRFSMINSIDVHLAYTCPGGQVTGIAINSVELSDLPSGQALKGVPFEGNTIDVIGDPLVTMSARDPGLKYDRRYYHLVTAKLTLTLKDGTTRDVTDTFCCWNDVPGMA